MQERKMVILQKQNQLKKQRKKKLKNRLNKELVENGD